MRRYLLIVLLCGSTVLSAAWGADHTRPAQLALAAKQQQAAPPFPTIGAMRINQWGGGYFHAADGRRLMVRPNIAYSYDSKARDVSRFYRPDKPQVNVLLHYAGRSAGEVISFGVDSGFAASKLSAEPAIFLGYARAFEVRPEAFLSLSAGGWLGGRIKHEGCVDELGRVYYCATLTAWSDFHAPKTRKMHYAHFVFKKRF